MTTTTSNELVSFYGLTGPAQTIERMIPNLPMFTGGNWQGGTGAQQAGALHLGGGSTGTGENALQGATGEDAGGGSETTTRRRSTGTGAGAGAGKRAGGRQAGRGKGGARKGTGAAS